MDNRDKELWSFYNKIGKEINIYINFTFLNYIQFIILNYIENFIHREWLILIDPLFELIILRIFH